MKLVTVNQTEHRLAKAWYVKYPLDAYALGPYCYEDFVPAGRAIEDAEEQFGEKPGELWPEGEEVEVAEYRFETSVPAEDREMYESPGC